LTTEESEAGRSGITGGFEEAVAVVVEGTVVEREEVVAFEAATFEGRAGTSVSRWHDWDTLKAIPAEVLPPLPPPLSQGFGGDGVAMYCGRGVVYSLRHASLHY